MGYAAGAGPDTIDLVSTSGSSDVTSESESRETSESGSHVDSSGLSSHHFNNEQTGMQEYNAKDKASVIKHELLAHYSAQTSSATFATSGACPDAVNPCLSVTGIGTVGLPLSDRDAKAIIGASRQAPYGKGTETFVDTSVRKTWEIDADAFQVRNAAWPKFLEGILKKVSHDLGIIGGSAAIEARPYKMLLYEEGAMFKPHKDSEKEDRMFGTLVICLPAEHTGGAVHARLGQSTKIYETEKNAAFDTSYIAWYADVTHEVKPVTSGYRFVLTYNLVYTASGTVQTAATLGSEMTRLRELLMFWMAHFQEQDTTTPSMLVMVLRHQYTDASLKLNWLKGRDKHFVRLLADACAKEGFCVFLANLEKMVEGGCDEDDYDEVHEIVDVCQEELYLTRVVDLEGSLIGGRMDLDEDDLVQKNPFKDPEEEDYSGYTGNEGVSATHFYRNTGIIIMPGSFRSEFLFDAALAGGTNVKGRFEHLIKDFEKTPEGPAKDELGQLCDFVISSHKRHKVPKGMNIYGRPRYENEGFSNEVWGMVIKAAFLLKRPDLCCDAGSICKQWPMSLFSDVGTRLHLLPCSEAVLEVVEQAIVRLASFHQRYRALDSVMMGAKSAPAAGEDDDSSDSLESWERCVTDVILDSILESAKVIGKEDGEALASFFEKFPSGVFSDKAVACAVNNLSVPSFVMAFASTVLKAGEDDRIPQARVTEVFHEIFPGVINAFTLQREHWSKRQKTGTGPHQYPYVPAYQQKSTDLVDASALAHVLSQCMRLGMESELEQLFSNLETEVDSSDGSTLDGVLVKFLKQFLHLSRDAAVTNRVKTFVRCLIASYITNYIQAEPLRPTSWARSPKGCGCNDCLALDTFLTDPNMQTAHFPVAEPRRKHLYYRLPSSRGVALWQERHQHGDFDVWTVKDRSPYSLVISKTEREWSQAHAEWQKRRQKASQQIKQLGRDGLKRIFADEDDQATYNALIQLRVVKPEQDIKPEQDVKHEDQYQASAPHQPGRPAKRKRENSVKLESAANGS